MTKIKLVLSFLMVLSILSLSTAQMTSDIIKTETINGVNITYEYEREFILTSPVYGIVTRQVLQCNVTQVANQSNTSVCGMVDKPMNEIVSFENIYRKGRLKQLTIENTGETITDEGCYPCGTYLLCIDKDDGFSEERAEEFKCQLRSGETGRQIPI